MSRGSSTLCGWRGRACVLWSRVLYIEVFALIDSMLSVRSDVRFVALDCETTGLDIESNALIQVGVLVCDSNFTVVDSYESLVHP